MSFSLPQNVPSFTAPQRQLENSIWGSSGTVHGRANGVGQAAGNGHFIDKELPMYKDKPYNYGGSDRRAPVWRRKPTLALGTLAFLGILYLLRAFSGSDSIRPIGKGNSWSWLKSKDSGDADWDERRDRVRDAFIVSWDAYEKHAWGYDEFSPLSRKGKQMGPKGLGWIIVDSLDTLMLMNLTSRLSHAREWLTTSLDYDQNNDVSTFETTIRMLGGLLAAHYLSTAYPDLAPIADDDLGAPGEDLYLEKASDLAGRLLGAFESKTGIPYADVNLITTKGKPSIADSGASSTAEAATLQLEFKYLAKLTGEKHFWDKAEQAIRAIDNAGARDGLVPIFIFADKGQFKGDNIRLGSRGDSYYEYLIKQYLQTSKQEPIYLDLWEEALRGVRKHLITYSKPSNLVVLGERPNGLDGPLSPKMDHLVCFMPGTIALAVTGGASEAEARKSGKWTTKQTEEMELARELMKTCWGMYKVSATGLAPEIAYFHIYDPPKMEDSKMKPIEHLDAAPSAKWKSDYELRPMDRHNLQRPETVESLFYMWRITGDVMYREWGWEMFKSFVEHTAVEGEGGFTSLADVTEIPAPQRDNMESFWLAETLKYFYLLFSPPDLLPLTDVVINTEAHPFPRFELGKLFKTGWERLPRDADGQIIPSPDAEHLAEQPVIKKKPANVVQTLSTEYEHEVS